MKSNAPTVQPCRWLLLIHHLPPKPPYLRVKVWRRMQVLGAVPIKNSVYALPISDQTYEDFQWVLREIVAGGGEGTICEAQFSDGLDDRQIEALFTGARGREYLEIEKAALAVQPASKGRSAIQMGSLADQIARLRRRLGEVVARDFFGAPERAKVERALSAVEKTIHVSRGRGGGGTPAAHSKGEEFMPGKPSSKYRSRTWVTRKGMHVDRIASAWLIRKFIDPDARFKWVAQKDYRALKGEVRFDMFEAEFTHVGDRCTFEVLLATMGIKDKALQPIQEIVHDLDLKDSKFGRPEVAGIGALLAGIATPGRSDEDRLAMGTSLFEGLYESFRAKGT